VASVRGIIGAEVRALFRHAAWLVACGALLGCAGRATNVLEDDGSGGNAGGGDATAGSGDADTNAPEWRCLSHDVPSERLRPVTVTFRLLDILDISPIVGARAKLCGRSDVDCRSPLSSDETSNEEGLVKFDLPPRLSGYVQITSEVTTPTLYFFASTDFLEDTTDVRVQVITPGNLAALSGLVASPQKDGNGFVLASVVDCLGEPGVGVRLYFDRKADGDENMVFYAVEGIPSRQARETDTSGFAGLINALPGAVTLKADLAADGRNVTTSSFLVKPNSATLVRLRPGH
jgi:hypothetical protein